MKFEVLEVKGEVRYKRRVLVRMMPCYAFGRIDKVPTLVLVIITY